MKALSIKQPWASLVVTGTKRIECRTWKTNFRGPLQGYAWHISPLYSIVPFPIKGKLNLFNVDNPLEKIPESIVDHWEYLRFQQGLSYKTR